MVPFGRWKNPTKIMVVRKPTYKEMWLDFQGICWHHPIKKLHATPWGSPFVDHEFKRQRLFVGEQFTQKISTKKIMKTNNVRMPFARKYKSTIFFGKVCLWKDNCLTLPKTNSSPRKINGWKMNRRRLLLVSGRVVGIEFIKSSRQDNDL